MRLEVVDSSGETIFDSGFKQGNLIDWAGSGSNSKRLADGAYLCIVTVKDASGALTRKQAVAVLREGSASLTKPDTSSLSAAQAQVAGPATEEDVSITIVESTESVATAVLAHDGASAQLVSGSGGLSIGSGDFFANKVLEHIRITAEGNVGIGVSNPQAKLDVAGMIRASQGIVFPDGSIQYSAATKTYGNKSSLPGSFSQPTSSTPTASGKQHIDAAGTGTLNFLPKWAETGGAGTLTNSAIFESGGNVGIGTTSPQFGFEFRGNNSASAFTRDIGTTQVTVPQSVLQLGLTNVASRSAGVGPSFLFFGDNSAGTKSFLGRVSGVWENPAAGSESGAILFQVRANSADTTASTERVRITAAGNVGIGVSAPAARLEVAGDVRSSGVGGRFIAVNPNNQGANAELDWINDGTKDWPRLRYGGNGEGAANGFLIQGPSNVTKLAILQSGSIGIGTTAPVALLDVQRDGNTFPETARFTTFGATNEVLGRSSGGTLAAPTATPLGQVMLQLGATGHDGNNFVANPKATIQLSASEDWTGGAQGTRIRFNTTTSGTTSTSTKMIIADNGNVGIGTTTPAAKLHIADNAGHILLGGVGCGSGFTGIAFGTTQADCTNYSLRGNGGDTIINAPSGEISFRTSNADKMRLFSNGSLFVFGDTEADTLSFDNNLNLGDAVLCYKFTSSKYVVQGCGSSIRLKKNVIPFTSGLSLIKRLRPVSFDWKSDGSHDVGLIAEDVDEVEPLLATHNQKGEVVGVKYEKIPVVLMNAVKEQQTQIEQQRDLIRLQQTQIQQQQKQVRRQAAELANQREDMAALKRLVCASHRRAAACKPRR